MCAVVAVLAVIAATGCTSRGPSDAQKIYDRAVVPESELRLGDAVMAFFVGPQNHEMFTPLGQVHEPGYLLLVSGDGSIRAVKTKRMDMMAPVWSEHGLYFADENSDYHLTASGLTKIANPKINAQNLMFALPEGGSVGVYNGWNEDDGGYLNQVVVTVAGAARQYPVQGNYFNGALCGDEIYGLTNEPGRHANAVPKQPELTSVADPTDSPQMLARLYPADGGEKIIGWRPHFGGGTPGGRVPCQDGVITFLSWDTDAHGRQQPSVVSWDTRTGAHRAKPLRFDDGTELTDEDFEDFIYVVPDLRDGELHWVYSDGRVFSTDPATGKTSTLYHTGLGTGSRRPMQTLFAFSETRLHALTTIYEADGDLTYTVFDRATGQVVQKVSVPIPNRAINVSYLALSRMAVPPRP